MRHLLVLGAVLALGACTRPQPAAPGAQPGADPGPVPPLSEFAAVLDPAQAAGLVGQCSRASPTIEGAWQPAPQDVAHLEADLPAVEGMESRACCQPGPATMTHVPDVNQVYRQYAGVVVGGRRLIYVNAFPRTQIDEWPEGVPAPDWRHEPFLVCDGGDAFWGVLYDPETRQFSSLAFNGGS